MLRKRAQLIHILKFVTDAILIFSCWIAIYYLRFNSGLFSFSEIPPLSEHLKLGVPVLACLLLTIKTIADRPFRDLSFAETIKQALLVNLIGISIIGLFLYFALKAPYSRVLIFLFAIANTIALTISHVIVKLILNSIRSKGNNVRFFYVVGNQNDAIDFAQKLESFKASGLKCSGIISSNLQDNSKNNFACMSYEEAINYFSKSKIARDFDYIYLLINNEIPKKMQHSLKIIQQRGKRLILVPSADLFDGFDSVTSYHIGDSLLITGSFARLTTIQLAFKSMLDRSAAFLGLLFLAVPFLVIAAIIKFTSKGPVFFTQERIGFDQKIFKMIKFRTMIIDAEKNNELKWTTENDPRITGIGAFLRRTSIDELPQLFNVLIGNMSLVGPRPERPELANEFTKEFKNYAIRHNVKAGLTGWAQVHGMRGDTSLRKRLVYDCYYLKRWSIWLDLWILILTPWHLIKGDGAY